MKSHRTTRLISAVVGSTLASLLLVGGVPSAVPTPVALAADAPTATDNPTAADSATVDVVATGAGTLPATEPADPAAAIQPRATGGNSLIPGVSISLEVVSDPEGLPGPFKPGQGVLAKYTIKNGNPLNIWWPASNDNDGSAILTDTLCQGSKMSILNPATGKGRIEFSRSNGTYLGIRAGQTGTLGCYFTVPRDKPLISNMTVNPAGLWSGGTKKADTQAMFLHKVLSTSPITKKEEGKEYTVIIPGSPQKDSQEAFANKPSWILRKTASTDYVKPSGEEVTYTFTVENTSGEKLYYGSMKDDHCWPLKVEKGLESDGYGQYIDRGGSAKWTCTANVTSETVGIAEASFKNDQGSVSWAGAATYVGIEQDTGFRGADYGVSRCDVIDFSTVNKTQGYGNLGSFVPGSKGPSYNRALSTKNLGNLPDSSAGHMTTASATSSYFPGYVYYAARTSKSAYRGSGLYGNLGLFRVSKENPGKVEKITEPHMMVAQDGFKIRGATATNRLAFGPDGRLWSLNEDGFLYSLDIDPATGTATGDWKKYGRLFSDESFDNKFDFRDLALGDIAVDGNNVMWIVGATRKTIVWSDGKETKKIDEGNEKTYLFSLALDQVLQENQKDPKDDSWKKIHTGAHFIAEVKVDGNYSDVRGFYGLAFAANGELYASYDPPVGNNDGSKLEATQVFTINLNDGRATHKFDSEIMKGTQDLSSCAFPKPVISAEKTASKMSGDGVAEFTITVTNSGNLAAANVVLKDVLEGYVANSSFLNGTQLPDAKDGNSPFAAGVSLRSKDAPGDLILPGQSAVVTLKAKARNLDEKVCNQAKVGNGDFNVGGNSGQSFLLTDDPTKAGEADETCVAVPQLKIKKTGGEISAVKPDDSHVKDLFNGTHVGWFKAVYSVEVSNPGTVPAVYTQIKDEFGTKARRGENEDVKSGLPQRMAQTVFWKRDGISEDKILRDDKGIFWIGDTEKKTVEKGKPHTYTVTLYFRPEEGYNWREELKQICNTADIEGPNVDRKENNVCEEVKNNAGKLRLQKAEYKPREDKSEILPHLGGAKFDLYPATQAGKVDYSAKPREIATTDAFDITSGVYFLIEKKSPQGLSLLPSAVRIEIVEQQGKLKALVEDGVQFIVKVDNPEDDGNNLITVTVNNVHTGNLPHTGGAGVWWPAGIAAAMILGGLGWVRRKQQLA